MSDWVTVGGVEEIPPGSYKSVDVDDVAVVVVNCEGRFHAIEDVCTHDGAELSGGEVADCKIVCPRHGATFDLKTGEALTPPAYEPVDTLPVKIEDGQVLVRDDRWD